jgi:transposase
MLMILAPVIDRAALPDAVETLKDMVMTLAQQVQAVRGQADAQLEVLRQQLAELRRRIFGPRSEVMHPGQAELWIDKVAVPVPPEQHTEVNSHKRRRKGRPAIDGNLPRRRVEYDLTDEDKAQFERVLRIGEEISETLEYTPAKLEVLQHVRLKYRCEAGDGNSTVLTAFAQASPLPKCQAGASLLAHVVVSKYNDHCPLARRERIFEREGLRVSRQTQCDWTMGTTQLLQRLMPVLQDQLLQAPVIFTDDTTLALRAPKGQRRGKTITARVWTYISGGARQDELGRWHNVAPVALYDFTTNRAGEHPRRILKDWSGWLQADDYAGYHRQFRDGRIKHAACIAHARRAFVDIVKAAPPGAAPGLAHEALRFFGEIYRIEREITHADPDERRRHRQQHTRPVAQNLLQWLQHHAPTLLPKSPLGQAFGYTLSNWAALTAFIDEGLLLADNNTAERAMRPVAISRKNWLWAGSERGGHAAAVAFSLIETAKLNHVEPYAWLRDVLQRINDHPVTRLKELLPMYWKPA